MPHDKKSEFWSTLLGGVDVEIRQLGEALHPHIPSWMKTPTVERLIGLIKGYVQGRHMEGLSGAVVERLTDILDVAFTGDQGPHGHTKSGKGIQDDWMKSFLADAKKRLAASDNKTAEMAAIREEYKLYKAFWEEISGEGRAAETPSEDHGGVDLDGLAAKVGQGLNSVSEVISTLPLATRGKAGWIEAQISKLKRGGE